jgi:hypothetical protein
MKFLSPRTGLLPKHVPADQWLVMEDVHLGYMSIYIGMKGTLFCDIDGTIADLEHRRVFVATKPKNYPAFERGIKDDGPIHHVIAAVKMLHTAGWTVVMCSGRRETQKVATVDWMATYDVPYDALYMRHEFEYVSPGVPKLTRRGDPMPDHRADYTVKKELMDEAAADGYVPDVVFDDRDQVVKMWRDNGVPVVQVAEGDF